MLNRNFAAIMIVATFFLAFPATVYTQNKIQKSFRKANHGIYVIAHRGAHRGIPENSLAAYRKAIELGCDFVEIDARVTRDGKIVSVHNEAIDNYVTGKSGRVKEMTLAEIKLLDIGEKTGNGWKGTRIPAVEEILELCHGKIGIYLDLKDAPIDELMKLIRKYNMESDVVWYIPYQYIMRLKNTETLFGNSFPMPDPGKKENIASLLEKIKTPVIATDMGELTPGFVDEATKYGAGVFADEKEGTASEWSRMIKMGVTGIQTDDPEALIQFLKEDFIRN